MSSKVERRGRPPTGEQKLGRCVIMRFTQAEFDRIVKLSGAVHLYPATWCRQQMLLLIERIIRDREEGRDNAQ